MQYGDASNKTHVYNYTCMQVDSNFFMTVKMAVTF